MHYVQERHGSDIRIDHIPEDSPEQWISDVELYILYEIREELDLQMIRGIHSIRWPMNRYELC